jgi:hypothetical protein
MTGTGPKEEEKSSESLYPILRSEDDRIGGWLMALAFVYDLCSNDGIFRGLIESHSRQYCLHDTAVYERVAEHERALPLRII